MSWEGPGFVDHHAHLLRVAAGRMRPYCEDGVANPARTAAWHRLLLEHESTPMDEAVEPLEVHDGLRGALERSLVHARSRGSSSSPRRAWTTGPTSRPCSACGPAVRCPCG